MVVIGFGLSESEYKENSYSSKGTALFPKCRLFYMNRRRIREKENPLVVTSENLIDASYEL